MLVEEKIMSKMDSILKNIIKKGIVDQNARDLLLEIKRVVSSITKVKNQKMMHDPTLDLTQHHVRKFELSNGKYCYWRNGVYAGKRVILYRITTIRKSRFFKTESLTKNIIESVKNTHSVDKIIETLKSNPLYSKSKSKKIIKDIITQHKFFKNNMSKY